MEKELAELMRAYQEARRRFREAEAKLQEVIEKSIRLEGTLPSLRSEIARADDAKTKAIHRYILGEIKEGEMNEAKMRVEEAKEAGKKQTEEIDALVRFREDIKQNLPRLKVEIQRSGDAVLQHLVNSLMKESREMVGDKISIAWSLNCLIGTAVDYQQFLELIFPTPPSELMARYQTEYQHKYLGNQEREGEE